jgi:1-phosphofructokinase family hexose kinase
MILTITPNPALDISGVVKSIIPNEKNYVQNERFAPGGNGINAARIIHRLKVPVLASGFLGGAIGSELERLLKREGVSCKFIKIKHGTRINVTVSNEKTQLQTRLSFPGPEISFHEMKKLFSFVSTRRAVRIILIAGSLPPNVSPTFVERIIRISKSKGIFCAVDMPGRALRQIVESKPDFIKPNLTEFQELIGAKVASLASVKRAARKLINKIPLICVSSVDGGALLMNRRFACFGRIPKVTLQSTVGAGDAMVGGILSRLFQLNVKVESLSEHNLEDLLRWGLASSCATLIQPGTELGEASAIQRFYSRVTTRSVTD